MSLRVPRVWRCPPGTDLLGFPKPLRSHETRSVPQGYAMSPGVPRALRGPPMLLRSHGTRGAPPRDMSCPWYPQGHKVIPQPPTKPSTSLFPITQHSSPWLWVPRQHPWVPGRDPWVPGGSVVHLSGSVATTKVVLLGKPAGHWSRQLRLLHLQQGQQRVGRPLDVVGMGVAFLPAFALWGDIGPSAPSRDDFSPQQVTHNYLSPSPSP